MIIANEPEEKVNKWIEVNENEEENLSFFLKKIPTDYIT